MLGKLDVAVNVGGVGFASTLRDLSDVEWHRTTDVNLNGVFYCMRAVLRVMKEGARIINMTSTGGVVAVPEMQCLRGSQTSRHRPWRYCCT